MHIGGIIISIFFFFGHGIFPDKLFQFDPEFSPLLLFKKPLSLYTDCKGQSALDWALSYKSKKVIGVLTGENSADKGVKR